LSGNPTYQELSANFREENASGVSGFLGWKTKGFDNQAFAAAELAEKDMTAAASSSIVSKIVPNFVNLITSRTFFAGLRSFSSACCFRALTSISLVE
jgi:hypothetical protein